MTNKIFNRLTACFSLPAERERRKDKMTTVVLYYFAIPQSWALLFDGINGITATIGLLCFWAGLWLGTSGSFRQRCDMLYDRLIKFHSYLTGRSDNHEFYSMFICVIFPMIIYGLLIWRLLSMTI